MVMTVNGHRCRNKCFELAGIGYVLFIKFRVRGKHATDAVFYLLAEKLVIKKVFRYL